MREETRTHYDRLAASYDQNWAYSEEFLDWISGCIVDRLRIQEGDRLVDLGCGTGLYARQLIERSPVDVCLCIDPSARMLKQVPDHRRLVPIQASAEDVASGRVLLPGGGSAVSSDSDQRSAPSRR